MDGIPRPEHPRPDMLRENWLCLNGPWDFGIGEGEAEKKITVPFPPESPLSGIGATEFMPIVRYSRSLSMPRDFAGKRIFLNFGAVDYRATVWMNGRPLGEHRGGYTPFRFEITEVVREGTNEILVQVQDDNRTGLQPCGKQSSRPESHGCHYTRVTGIWQSVWLEALGRTFIASASVGMPRPSGSLWVMVDLDGKPEGVVRAVALKDGVQVGEGIAPASRYAKIPVQVPEIEKWGPGNANLYDLELTLENGGGVVDRLVTYFGLRTVEVRGTDFLINGERVFQRLVLDQGYYPDGIYTAATDISLKRDIEISMEMGFNGARLHQKVFEPRFLYWADRLGYLTWGEFPSWGIDMSVREARENFVSEWSEAVRRDLGHPSIIGWCPFNETPVDQNRELVRTVYELTKSMDPGRPVIDTSGYTHVATDVYDSHDYDQNVETFAERHRSILEKGTPYQNHPRGDVAYGGQPVMVSEFGGTWWNPGQAEEKAWGYGERPNSTSEFLQRFAGLVGSLLDNGRVVGFCYTQLYDIEQEVNGLLAYDRTPKFDPAELRRILTREAAYESGTRGV